MNPQEIGQKLTQAKNNYNGMKGQADGLLHDAQSLFQAKCIEIIESQLTEIAQLHGEIKKLKKPVDDERFVADGMPLTVEPKRKKK